jgi:DNA-binding CsgD family transcriptional regulator
MPQRESTARVISRIQRLCCAGLGQAVVPELLREVAEHVRTQTPMFFAMNSSFKTTSFYSTHPDATEHILLYLQEFEEEREREVTWSASELFMKRRHSSVEEFLEQRVKVSPSDYYKSEMYNRVARPLGWERGLQANIVAGGRQTATLSFPRGANDPLFSKRDMRILETIAPFVAHTLTERSSGGAFVEGDDRGLIIVDDKCTPQHVSREARRLLLMARFPAWSPMIVDRFRMGPLPEEVVRLCQSVSVWSETRPLLAPPVWRHRNEWGEFVFRIFRTDQSSPDLPASRLIGISIERREPLRLKLLRRLGELPLSNRETDLCLALLEGHSRAEIAERLGIGEATAITHCRNLYGKLDVHNRSELAEKLHAL